MDPTRFDAFTRLRSGPGTRRRFVGVLAAGALGLVSPRGAEAARIPRGAGRSCRENANCGDGAVCARDARGRKVCTARPDVCFTCASDGGFDRIQNGSPVHFLCAPGTTCRPTDFCAIVCAVT